MSGTARGQGRAAALRFAAESAIVVGAGLRHESALVTRRLVEQAGGTAVASGPLDVTDEGAVRAWVEEPRVVFGASTSSAPPCAVCGGVRGRGDRDAPAARRRRSPVRHPRALRQPR
ncbi:hypothetical protein [Streptomyces sp. NPDC021608]|uniref:hypothetical protein n=1 Tax=Streptomyces sp. NPDC021608 TaxID=3154903 RepID=UPI0033FAA7D2